jgi:uncharacterized protein (DUF1778 family)
MAYWTSRLSVYAYQAYTGDMTATKDSRLAMRLSAEQDALIRQAAEAEGKNLTDFSVEAIVGHAREVLADRRLFLLDDAAWNEFQALLDRPTRPNPQLRKLLEAKPPWER